jgi:CheY-like chemotaxis protein
MPLVLIVDDLLFERERVRNLVQSEGYDCEEAADGLEALAVLDRQQPDCILSDLLMPQMDGLELLATLQERGSQIPVVVITCDRQPETRALCENLGAVAVLHKDWHPGVLAEVLKCHLAASPRAAGGV